MGNKNEERQKEQKSKELYFVKCGTNFSKSKDDYYCNDEPINLTEEGVELLDDNKFKTIIKKQIYEFCNPFERIVVLSGAGTSVVEKSQIDNNKVKDKNDSSYDYGYLMNELKEYIDKSLKNNSKLFSLKTIYEKCKCKDAYDVIGLEDLISALEMYKEYIDDLDKEKYLNTLKKIYSIIIDRTKYNLDKIHIHKRFIKTLSDMHKKDSNRLTIVTTNYDTLFEEAADELGYAIIDGFSFLMKPRFDSDVFNWSFTKPIEGYKTEKVEYKKNIINLIKIHGSLTWIKEKNSNNEKSNICRIDKNDILKRMNESEISKPLLIFPGNSKFAQSYEEPYFELFSTFQDLIHRPQTLLIVVGFGFNDKHIVSMIEQAIKVNLKLSVLIITPDISKLMKNNNISNINNLMNSKYNIAFLKSKFNNDLMEYFLSGDKDEN